METTQKCWSIRKTDRSKAKMIAEETGMPELIAAVLLNRGCVTPEEARLFIEPKLDSLHDPFLLKDMDKAAERIMKAVKNHEKILIYGDYDVDGITASAILLRYFAWIMPGHITECYIPDRAGEGYGLTPDAAREIAGSGISLLITVDCGITSFEETEYLMSKGVDVIITDHHECRKELPAALAVINPHREDCRYPFRELAGAGVAFKLAQALHLLYTEDASEAESRPATALNLPDPPNPTNPPDLPDSPGMLSLPYSPDSPDLQDLLDLAALGTIADMVPLKGENRIIAKYGLERINAGACKGIAALMKAAGIENRICGSWEVSFVLAPRINAAGRMGDAKRALSLFMTRDNKEAAEIADCLNSENKARQEVERETVKQAAEAANKRETGKACKIIVEYYPEWHQGVIGIAASKLVEMFGRPCILLTSANGNGYENGCGADNNAGTGAGAKTCAKGSGRSIEGFNLMEAIKYCSDILERYGGHEMAAGLSLSPENIDLFRKKINEYAEDIIDEKLMEKAAVNRTDGIIGHEDLNSENAYYIEQLEPFGEGNPEPVFLCQGLVAENIRQLGAGNKHLKLKLTLDQSQAQDRARVQCQSQSQSQGQSQGQGQSQSQAQNQRQSQGYSQSRRTQQLDAIGFNMGSLYEQYMPGDEIDAIFSMRINRWNGSEMMQLNLRDIRKKRAGR